MINKQKMLGLLAYYLTKILRLTLRTKIIMVPEYNKNTQYLFAFWHGKQLLPVLELVRHNTTRAVLASPSRDGEILATWLGKLGYKILRGSSRQDNIKSLVQMLRSLKAGDSLGFGVDGPIGPEFVVKPGITYMAQKANVAIIPVGSAFSRKWVFARAWDNYQMPKPFAQAVLYLGKPIYIAQDVDLEQASLLLAEQINNADFAAADIVK